MVYKVYFSFNGLTEDELFQVVKKVELIKDHIYSDLDIGSSLLHRENTVWVDQEIADEGKALEVFRLLCNVGVDKSYDDYYETGVDSRLECCLSYVADFPL